MVGCITVLLMKVGISSRFNWMEVIATGLILIKQPISISMKDGFIIAMMMMVAGYIRSGQMAVKEYVSITIKLIILVLPMIGFIIKIEVIIK